LDTSSYCWSRVSSIPGLSEEFMSTFSDKLNWDTIIFSQKLSDEFICKFSYKMRLGNLVLYQKLSEKFLEDHLNEIKNKGIWSTGWSSICQYQKLSESFIEKHCNCVNWEKISQYQILSEDFIEKFKALVDWDNIFKFQRLSEQFMERNSCHLNALVSRYQKLSEDFIEKFQDKLDSQWILQYQKLSPEFIEKLNNIWRSRLRWDYLFKYQKLPEEFIEKHLKAFIDFYQDYELRLILKAVFKYQKFSEKFIEKLYDALSSSCEFPFCRKHIGLYQKVSQEFIDKYDIIVPSYNWLYATVETKEKYIREYTKYKIEEDEQGKYVLAHKGIRRDNYSAYNFQYKYEIGQEYESHCDCNLDAINSFGLSAWTLDEAKEYCNEKIILVKIYLEDIGAIVHDGNKIRCFKFKVMEEVNG